MASARAVFLTGATGFIGGRLARRLAEAGDRLRCLVRPGSETGDLKRLGAELVTGDVTDQVSLERGLEGVDLAYHLAAVYDVGLPDVKAMERTNVGGTEAFLAAVEKAGTPRSVYVSTTLALGPVDSGADDESTEHRGPYRSAYERTKVAAHRRARDAQARGLPLVIACPAVVYGPGGSDPFTDLMRDLLARRVPGLLSRTSWWSFVHVDDVADGLVRIGEAGRPGETYILSGEDLSLHEFVARVAELGGTKPPRLRFPVPVARLTASLLDVVARTTGRRFAMTREGVDSVAGGRYVHSHAKAIRELGWRPRPLADGLPETVAWVLGSDAGPAPAA